MSDCSVKEPLEGKGTKEDWKGNETALIFFSSVRKLTKS